MLVLERCDKGDTECGDEGADRHTSAFVTDNATDRELDKEVDAGTVSGRFISSRNRRRNLSS